MMSMHSREKSGLSSPEGYALKEGVFFGSGIAERIELWRSMANREWERVLARKEAPPTDRAGVRALPVSLTRWKELGFLRSFRHRDDEESVPTGGKGTRVEPSQNITKSSSHPYLVIAETEAPLTESALTNAGLEWDALEYVDTERRIALITGMYRELSERVLMGQKSNLKISSELAYEFGGVPEAEAALRDLEVERLYRQIALVTGSTADSESFPVVPFHGFGWRMRSNTYGMKTAFDSKEGRFRLLSHFAKQEQLGVSVPQLRGNPHASREILSHEFAHRRTRWMWNNPIMIEAVPYVANSLVAEQCGENFSGHIHEAPQILLARHPNGEPIENPGFDIGDNADYSQLGTMGEMIIRCAGYHLFQKWLGGKRAHWQQFMKICDKSSFVGNSPEKEEFLRAISMEVPGFRERFNADSFTKPACDGTYAVFLPNTRKPRSQEHPLRRGILWHYAYQRNPNFGLSAKRSSAHQPSHPDEFDCIPGAVQSLPIKIVYEWRNANGTLKITQSGRGDGGCQHVYPFARLVEQGKHHDFSNTPCHVSVIAHDHSSGAEQSFDLGEFASDAYVSDSEDARPLP